VNRSFSQKRLGNLQFQRNVLLGYVGFLLLTTTLQSTFLFLRSERIIINPPELKQSYWVEGNRFAPHYLEEMALYFSHLLLDVHESNVWQQGDIVLRYVEPQFYEHFKTKIVAEEQRLKKEHLSLHFVPIEVQVFPHDLACEITGDLLGYVGGKQVTTHREMSTDMVFNPLEYKFGQAY
jgi:conjugal transfer pilus assembly protein TraE